MNNNVMVIGNGSVITLQNKIGKKHYPPDTGDLVVELIEKL